MIDGGKHNLLGVLIDAVDYDACVRRVLEAAHAGRSLTVSALAVHGVMTGALDPTHRHRLNEIDVVAPDGQPVRWALGWLHRVHLEDRVYGPELMLRVCRAAAAANAPVFLFGSSEEVLSDLQARLLERIPGLIVAGSRGSRFREITANEQEALAAEIRDSGARIVFVGLGCPRQEVFIHHMGSRLNMPTLAVGAAFAFHAGRLSQAPPWMQRRGLEWLYRFLAEPTRLWRRYLILNPYYLLLVTSQLLGRQFSSHPEAAAPSSQACPG